MNITGSLKVRCQIWWMQLFLAGPHAVNKRDTNAEVERLIQVNKQVIIDYVN